MYKQISLWDNLDNSEHTEKISQPIAQSLSMLEGDVVIYHTLFDEKESNQLFSELYNHTN